MIKELTQSGELELALLLARMIDSLRFGLGSAWLVRSEEHDFAHQQRQSLIQYLAATLNELEDWKKKNSASVTRFQPLSEAFGAMESVPVTPDIRAAMGRLRNKVVSHFDENVFQRVLPSLPDAGMHFASGAGDTLLADSNDLANASVLFFAHDTPVDYKRFGPLAIALLDAVMERAQSFAFTGRDALHTFLVSRGAVWLPQDARAV